MSDELRWRVIAGLGNPGRQYANNRHNVGFLAADYLAREHGLAFTKMMNHGLVAQGLIKGARVVIVKPQTFMNDSGLTVGPLLRFYKSALADLLVIYDELDLPFGQIRMRPSGSAGGHNGMKSIIPRVGGQEFPRIRVGIGRPPGRQAPKDYVLDDFGRDEVPVLDDLFKRIDQGVQRWVTDGLDMAMNLVNPRAKQDPGKSKKPGASDMDGPKARG